MQVSNRLVPILIATPDGDDVIPGLAIPMLCHCVAGRVVLIRIAIGLYFNRGASIPKIPQLLAMLCAEGAHLERHFIAGPEAEGGIVICVNRRRHALGMLAIDYINHRKIVCEIPGRVCYLYNLVVLTSSLIYPLDLTACSFGPIAECPLVFGNLSCSGPAFRSVKLDCLVGVDQMMRSGYCDNLGAVLLLIHLPDECVAVLRDPLA